MPFLEDSFHLRSTCNLQLRKNRSPLTNLADSPLELRKKAPGTERPANRSVARAVSPGAYIVIHPSISTRALILLSSSRGSRV